MRQRNGNGDQRHDCSATVFGERVHSWQCTRKAVVERAGKWYCRQHDPEAVAQRRAKSNKAFADHRAKGDAIVSRGEELAARLGVEANVFYQSSAAYFRSGYREALVVSFEDVERLIAFKERHAHCACDDPRQDQGGA